MQRGAENKYNNPRNPLRRHAVLGWFRRTGKGSPPTAARLEEMLVGALQVSSEAGADFALAATGGVSALAGGGAVAYAGSPRFADTALERLAAAKGFGPALAEGYGEHAQEVFRLLRGPFVACIVDPGRGRVLAAIDRTGQHTCYYSEGGGDLCFGSDAAAVLSLGGRQGVLSSQGIYNYLYFHMVPSPGSVYTGLGKLPAAHYLLAENEECHHINYWLPQFTASSAGKTMDSLSGELRDILREAVGRAIARDSRTGSFLSGGLDSSTVTGVMSELCGTEADAYAIGFDADGYDEMEYARTTARHFGVRLNEYYVTPQDVVEALPLIATSYPEPFGNSSALPAYFCARMARENGVDLLLAGDGGDEIFAGNERYVRQDVFDHYARIPRFLRSGLIEPLVRILPQAVPLAPKAKSYIAQANTPLPDRLQSYNFLHRHAAREIFTADFLTAVDTGLPLELLREVYGRPAAASDLDRMLYLDWQFTLADNDLRKVSQMCAVAGVDVAYPMLDDTLVELSCRIPSAWKIRRGDLRHFFKRATTGWLPDSTIRKTKQGFGLPFGVWMQTYRPLRELAYDNLLKMKTRGFVRPEFIDRAIEMHQSEHAAYYGELVWILSVFELWMAAQATDHCAAA